MLSKSGQVAVLAAFLGSKEFVLIENIVLKDFPHSSGVYWFVDENDEIIYVGSSKNIYDRMRGHRSNIKRGYFRKYNLECQKELYQFLQKNFFRVEFKISETYIDLEKQLIEKYEPIFNKNSILLSEEERMKSYRQRHKRYVNKLCNYKGEILKMNTLAFRFRRQGIVHYWTEAKKYLI